MAENGCNAVENLSENDDSVVSVREYINEVEERELHADLVLGGDKGEECTYSRGYLPRQAVFSCLTCTPAGNGGFCTACSLACHDGHTVMELWTKRKFRCDCGNSKFGSLECKLFKDKDPENINNSYNQNFLGLYCTCHRRYPEPEDSELGEMLQCCICEDWFHEKHLGLLPDEQVPRDGDAEYAFDEIVCPDCVQYCSFLSSYKHLFVEPFFSDQGNEKILEQPCSSVKGASISAGQAVNCLASTSDGLCTVMKEGTNIMEETTTTSELAEDMPNSSQELRCNGDKQPDIPVTLGVADAQEVKCLGEDQLCKLKHPIDKVTVDDQVTAEKGDSRSLLKLGRAVFLREAWRSELCRCDSCQSMYEMKGLTFLLEKGDTLVEYEERAKEMRKEHQEQEADATNAFLHNLNRVQQIEFLHGWNDMTSELTSFLKEFEESKKTVTAPDIHEFFENLTKKRRRVN
ncbi:hypothetical protein O6H91_14G054400 [Diphasiastrum complanatum]|uniref:Uncharacterized protein n=3 Tax=Diphasiastrum complanatum TaxID=34168 RepID=A0ACC2BPF9_DIPCM|nr:hypothetical protein O6H91_14G054000 [Diphasiastrum complanatum]KAJ7531688.1 hypothetical protein O6H91_14G054400 [Diphasiastrum complanatum]KAJ7531689.1 hypothetical protein O6H91_14G054400 [Diphasiastrum complanatum]